MKTEIRFLSVLLITFGIVLLCNRSVFASLPVPDQSNRNPAVFNPSSGALNDQQVVKLNFITTTTTVPISPSEIESHLKKLVDNANNPQAFKEVLALSGQEILVLVFRTAAEKEDKGDLMTLIKGLVEAKESGALLDLMKLLATEHPETLKKVIQTLADSKDKTTLIEVTKTVANAHDYGLLRRITVNLEYTKDKGKSAIEALIRDMSKIGQDSVVLADVLETLLYVTNEIIYRSTMDVLKSFAETKQEDIIIAVVNSLANSLTAGGRLGFLGYTSASADIDSKNTVVAIIKLLGEAKDSSTLVRVIHSLSQVRVSREEQGKEMFAPAVVFLMHNLVNAEDKSALTTVMGRLATIEDKSAFIALMGILTDGIYHEVLVSVMKNLLEEDKTTLRLVMTALADAKHADLQSSEFMSGWLDTKKETIFIDAITALASAEDKTILAGAIEAMNGSEFNHFMRSLLVEEKGHDAELGKIIQGLAQDPKALNRVIDTFYFPNVDEDSVVALVKVLSADKEVLSSVVQYLTTNPDALWWMMRILITKDRAVFEGVMKTIIQDTDLLVSFTKSLSQSSPDLPRIFLNEEESGIVLGGNPPKGLPGVVLVIEALVNSSDKKLILDMMKGLAKGDQELASSVALEVAEYPEVFAPLTEILAQDKPAHFDVNKDGVVDILDLALVAKHYGEKVAQDFSKNPDVNRDGIIDIFDLVLVGAHFGERLN